MQIGIDFGTSYSAAAAYVHGRLEGIRFGEQSQFRTAVFFPAAVPDPADFNLDAEREREVEDYVRSARAAQRSVSAARQQRRDEAGGLSGRDGAGALGYEPASRSEADLRAAGIRHVRRNWMERLVRESQGAVVKVNDALFGDEAIDAYINDGLGHLVESPKSMLGYQLLPNARRVILHIASHVLEHIRLSATRQLGTPVRTAILGRPVEFKSAMGARGTTQALEMLTEAAQSAGFEQIAFLEEPAAAAMHYHTQLSVPERSLIVDVGGGTTDVAFAEVGGGAAAARILGSWGLPRGGTDIDIELSLAAFMPLFGRGHPLIPVHHFREAASVHSPPQQKDFRGHDYRDSPQPFGARLQALQRTGSTSLLNREAERMKIALGQVASDRVGLDFIEDGLVADLDPRHRDQAYTDFLDRLAALLRRVRADIDAAPDSIFLTGGSSRAPLIREAVAWEFPGIRMVIGDASLGVVSGLAVAAQQWQL
jgi:hypothetical chaperone protein